MLWFRWYHGTVSDPKLAAIAKRTGVPKPFVLALWAAVLENASGAKTRGQLTVTDEELAVLVDCDTSVADTVLKEFRSRKLIKGNKVTAFEVRNPKRDDSYDRVKKYREKKRVTETPVTRDSHASETRETGKEESRGDENREETDTPSPSALRAYLGENAGAVDRMAAGVKHPQFWEDKLYALFGPKGTDEMVWKGSQPTNRPAILAKALDRYSTTGRSFDGMYFRAFITKAIDEHNRNGSGDVGTAGKVGGKARRGAAGEGELDHLS